MAKKMPKGYSVKTIPHEYGLTETYGWIILYDGKQIKASSGFHHSDTIDARKEGLTKMWEIVEN